MIVPTECPQCNGRMTLIKAAPDLLAALSLAGKFLADNYADADMPDILPAVRAALAQAAP